MSDDALRVQKIDLGFQPSWPAAALKLAEHCANASTSIRIETRCPTLDILRVLKNAQCQEKFYWSDRRRITEWAGLGVAWQQEALPVDSELSFFGAIPFDSTKPSTFVLPFVELKSSPEGTEIALNVRAKFSAEHVLGELSQLHDGPFARGLAASLSDSRVTGFEKFREKFVRCKALLNDHALDKIVLANAHDFYFEEAVDPVVLLSYLDEKSPHTFRFLFQLTKESVFVGASPEQLFQRTGRRIESEAQAGTRARGKNPSEDSALAFELLESQKEFIEHDLVIQDIEKGLSPLCADSGWIDQRQVIKLSHVQHLRSRFGGILKPHVSDADIIETLHPTAAVCGSPKTLAKSSILELEDFDRGYYCGAIGLVGKERTELAVGLRSALVESNHIRIFAGAGLVSGSRAEDEWDEIDSKMRLYHQAFRP
jgi:menaquinone-specific isochorismate synthase